jgi:hypothetical protein
MSNIKLSEIPKYKKFQLAYLAGYKVIENNNRYKIDGADNFIDNDFRSIDDILRLIANDLKRKGFKIAA